MGNLSINKNKLISVIIKFVPMVATIVLAIYISKDIVTVGHVRTRVILIFVPFLFIWIQRLSNQAKFKLLLLALFLIPLQAYNRFWITPSELIFFAIAFWQFPIFQLGRKKVTKSKISLSVLMLYGIFAFSGLISAVINKELHIWHLVCLTPLLWMYLATRFVHTPEGAFKLIRMALFSVLFFIFFLLFGNLTGHATSESIDKWRIVGESIAMGPFYLIYTPLRFGTMLALVFPTVTMLLFRKDESIRWKFFYGSILIIFLFYMIKISARGATIAALFGAALILVYIIRFHIAKALVIYGAIFLIFIVLRGPFATNISKHYNLERGLDTFSELAINPLGDPNFRDRMNTLMITIENTKENPFGNGFQYLWTQYGIDEAISYSVLLNGTGIAGFISFMIIMGHLFLHFAMSLGRKFSKQQHELAFVGMATLSCGLLAGVSSESVVWNPVNTMVFWAILASCFAGTQNKPELAEEQ